MNRLSLSMRREKTLPASVTVDGVVYDVNADFRIQLKIIRLLDDDEIADRHKPAMACALFFGLHAPQNGLEIWQEWVRGEERESDPDAPDMSYEYDAGDIYASFLGQYGIDLLDEKTTLHWYQFRALLDGLSEDSPLRRTLAIRGLDVSALKGNVRSQAERAKRNAQLPEKISEGDRRIREKLNQLLLHGGDPAEVLGM